MENSADKITAFSKIGRIVCWDKVINLQVPVVMGILNITPDSFYDGGSYFVEKEYLKKTGEMIQEGAAIIDIGAISTRPGADLLTVEEEMKRILPAVKALTREFPDIVLSVDTFRSDVARAAAGEGASIINDVSGGNLDPEMFRTVAGLKIPYILMHMQGIPQTMQKNPQYKDIIEEIGAFFEKSIARLEELGATEIILDPGFGFGKTIQHNYTLLKQMQSFSKYGKPILAGLSRKSMVTRVLDVKAEDALGGTTALNMVALLNGASILRVHDVKAASEVIRLFKQYISAD